MPTSSRPIAGSGMMMDRIDRSCLRLMRFFWKKESLGWGTPFIVSITPRYCCLLMFLPVIVRARRSSYSSACSLRFSPSGRPGSNSLSCRLEMARYLYSPLMSRVLRSPPSITETGRIDGGRTGTTDMR